MNRIKNVGITVGTIGIATLVGMVMRQWQFTEANIVMSYIIGIVVIARYTTSWEFSVIGAFSEVALFNFFFAAPYYSFKVDEVHYIITFSTMLVVAFVIITLTGKVKKEVEISQEKEAATQKLYEASRRLLEADRIEQTKATSTVLVADLLRKSTFIFEVDEKSVAHSPLLYDYEEYPMQNHFLDEQLTQHVQKIILNRQAHYDIEREITFIPVVRHDNILGLFGIRAWDLNTASEQEQKSLEAIIAQVGLALDREYARNRNHEMKMNVQKEKLKNSMLQGISHDLRTPLTGILGSTHILLESRSRLTEGQVDELLNGIHDEANWLYHSVENILNITRIDDGRQIIKKELEVVQDIVEAVLSRMDAAHIQHPITVDMGQEVLVAPMDANLIVKVLYNLVDNAIKYTPIYEPIKISVYAIENEMYIEVTDHGPGIREEDLPHIFRRFYRGKNKLQGVSQSRNGMGIGLAICKAIVEAHGGKITVCNNEIQGATFKMILPMEETEENGQ